MSDELVNERTLKAVAQRMASMGVGLHCAHPHPHGQKTVYMDATELPSYVADAPAWFARHYGIERGEYLAWHQARYQVKCCALTTTGRPCENTARGGNSREPAEWVRMAGQQLMCPNHEVRGVAVPKG